jgi:hypothetical protein
MAGNKKKSDKTSDKKIADTNNSPIRSAGAISRFNYL